MENPTAYATHTEIVAANQFVYCTTSKNDLHLLVNPNHYHQVRTHVTYYVATSTIPRTAHSIL